MKKRYFLFLLSIPIFLFTNSFSQEFKLKEYKEIRGYSNYIREAKFSPFNNYFVITEGSNMIEVFNNDWEIVYEHKGDPESYAGYADFSPDEKYLFVARYKSSNDIAIIKLPEAKVITVLIEHTDGINGIGVSPDGKYFASCGDDKTVNVWKIENNEFIHIYKNKEHKKRVNDVVFSNDNRFLISISNDKTIHIKEIVNDKVQDFQTLDEGKYYLKTIAYHPHLQEFVTGCADMIKIWSFDKNQFKLKDSISEKVGNGYSLDFSPDGKYLAASIVTVGRIWDYSDKNKTLEQTIQRPVAVRFGVQFSQDGKLLSTSSMENVLIWEIEGVSPSKKALMASYLGTALSPAQIRILTPKNVDIVLGEIDAQLTQSKGEFETTKEFEARKEKLHATTLLQIQLLMEDFYGIKYKAKENKIYATIDELLGYDADNEIYNMLVMNTECQANIPRSEAKSLKENWKKAEITASKRLSNDKISYDYSHFQIIHPISQKEYKLSFDNPFESVIDNRIAEARAGKDSDSKTDLDSLSNEYGNTQALFFVCNDYQDPFITDLINPVFDGNTIKEELANNYGATIEFIENPTLDEIMAKLREYAANKYDVKDKMLIFFAGHGMFDEVFKEGYIIASDSKYADESKLTYLSHSNLRTIVNNIPCEHILLVLDVCFGGTFDPAIASRSADSDMYKEVTKSEFINRKLKYKTRLYITSGGKEYVPDGRPGHHSPFARRFLEALRSYGGKDGIITINEILVHIEKVEPEPRFGEFGDNEPGSDFILIAR